MKANILERMKFSLLDGLSAEDRGALASELREIEVPKGSWVRRNEQPSDLHIVYAGEVSLRSKTNSVHEYSRIVAGRSIELKVLFSGEPAWEFAWRAEKDSRILILPWASVKKFLAKDAKELEYLRRMTCAVELQKLRRDLTAFGLNQDHIFELISALKFDKLDTQLAKKEREDTFYVLSSGFVNINAELDGGVKPLSIFQGGDHFILDQNTRRLLIEPKAGAQVWWFKRSEWMKCGGAKLFDFFLTAHNPMYTSEQLPVSERTRRIAVETPTQIKRRKAGIWQGMKAWLRRTYNGVVGHETRIIQPDPSWGGAACLTMVAHKMGYRLGMASVRDLFAGTERVEPLATLERIANRLGFKAEIVDRPDGSFHFDIPHIIISRSRPILLYSMGAARAHIYDPASGEKSYIDNERFLQSWDGTMLELLPSRYLRDNPDPPVQFSRYFGIFRGSVYKAFLLSLATLLLFLFSLTPPMLTQYVFEHVLIENRSEMILLVMIVCVVFTFVCSVFEWIQMLLATSFMFIIEAKMASAIVEHLVRLRLEFFDRFGKGDALARIETAKEVGLFLSGDFLKMVVNVGSAVLCGALLYVYHPKLLLVSVAAIPILLLVSRLFAPRIRALKTVVNQLQTIDRGLIVESFDNIDMVKSHNGFRAERWKWEANYIKMNLATRKLAWASAIFGVVSELSEHIVKMAVLVGGVSLYVSGELTIGKVIASTFLIERFVSPVWLMVNAVFDYAAIRSSAALLQPIFDEPAEITSGHSFVEVPAVKGDLTFKGVSFAYGAEAQSILNQVDFTIKQGEIVAILGENGTGKSTLAALMNGTRLPTSGTISLAGGDIHALDPRVLKRSVCTVPQQSKLFKGSVFENISMCDESATHEKVWAAVQNSGTSDLIDRLPKGLETQIGSGGLGLSVGQAQQIVLARAAYRNPTVFVLDEALSHLDPISQEQTIKRFLDFTKGKTVVIITQHLGLLSRTDRVILIKDGRIAANGKHSELIQSNRKYFEFFSQQLAVTA